MKRFHTPLVFILCVMLGISSITLHGQTRTEKKAALVVTEPGLSAGFDGAMFKRLVSLGYDVEIVTGTQVKDGAFTIAKAESKDLLVISESIGSGDVVNLAGAAVPILHMESFGWNKLGWTGGNGRGWTSLNGYIDVSQSPHTILSKSGLSSVADSLSYFTVDSLQATSIWPSSLPAGTKVLATKDTMVISWAIEQGTTLTNGTQAPARIAAFPLPGYPTATYTADVMTDEGWNFFEAAVAWLVTTPADFIGSAALVVTEPGLSAGFDGAMFDRLLSLGYDVEIVTGTQVKDGAFTIASAENKDLLVISESIGSGDVVNLAGASVPILHMESFGWNKLGWTGGNGRGWTSLNGYIDVSQSPHTILSKSGLSSVTDSLSYFTVDSLQATSIWPSSLPAGTKVLATKDTMVISWAIEQGTTLANGTQAPARIAAFPLPGYPTATYTADVMTDEGWNFFEAAVAWLVTTPADFIGSAALVVTEPGLSAGFDGAMFDRLLSLGYDVEIVTGTQVKDGAFTIASAENKDLLVISESIGSGDVVNLAGASVPILHMESFGWNKLGWTGGNGRGWTSLNGYIDVSQSPHTILSKSGLSSVTDSLSYFTVDSLQATSIWPSSLPAGTKVLATKDTMVISWAIEQGTTLANGTQAPARIAAFPLPGYPTATYTSDVMTDEGWNFFEAAVAWLVATPADFIGSAALVVTEPGLSAGFDGAMFDRLLSLGYDVEIVTGTQVKDGAFTTANAESKDLLVISESIGSGDVVNLAGASVPILHMESFGWNKLGWTGGNGRGWTSLNGYIDVSQSPHTILSKSGLSSVADSLSYFTVDSLQATSIWPSSLPAGTKVLATKDTMVISWAIEQGTTLANGTQAPARIAAFPLPGYPTATYPAAVLTDEGWNFFDAAIAWLVASPADFIGSAALVVTEPGLSAGFDGPIYDRLLSLGYDVEIVTGTQVKDGAFTIASAESKDLLVVSESIGSGDVVNLAGAGVNILHMESFGWNKLGWTGGNGRGWTSLNGYIDISQSPHAILSNAGLSSVTDSLRYFTVDSLQATCIWPSSLPAGTKVLATKDTMVISWAIEQGTTLANGTQAPARIAAFPLPGYPTATYTSDVMTDGGWNFFDAAIYWLTPPPSTGKIEPGIVSRYEFELGVSDKEGNFNGSVMGDAEIVTDFERGKVLSLTEDGYVSIDPAMANELKDFSIATWIKGLGTAEFGGLFGIGQSEAETNSYWDIHLQSNGTMSFYASKDSVWPPDGCAQTVDGFVNPGDDWYHLAVSFKKGVGATVYINGEAQTTSDWIGDNDFDVSPIDVAAKMVAIGKDAYTQSTLTNTLIDNFTVYNIAISQSVVEGLYNAEMHVPAPKLVADYVFDFDAKDATERYDGTLQGDAKLVRDEDRGTVLALTTDGYVSLPPEVTNALDDFSISAWVKGVASSETPALLGMGSGTAQTAPFWDIQLNGDGTMSFASSLANTTDPDGCAQVVDDFANDGSVWNHIVLAFTKDEGAVVYINGEVATTTALTGENDFSVSPIDLGAAMVAIGKSAFSQQTLDATLIDNFKIYKNAINADDVKEIFKNETPDASGGGGGGFTYSLNTSITPINNGGAAFDNYDGYWSHENGNDSWDGTGIGEGSPGGISKIDNYYRFQDTGDPEGAGLSPGDAGNRKLQGYCDLGPFGGTPSMLDDGATIHFVARIPTDGPLDTIVHTDGSTEPYPAEGDGYTHHNDGSLGMFAIKQGNGGYISFTLRTPFDYLNNNGVNVGTFTGLQLLPQRGNAIITGTDISAADTINTIALDPTQWHDYWINIEKDATGVGTHKVSVSVDGGEFQSFSVTATNHTNYTGMSVLRMGLGNTGMSGAYDIRAFDFAPGLLPPAVIPAAHWKFEENTLDEYGTSDGTLINGDASSYAESLEGQGMALDLGSGSPVRYVEVPDNDVVDFDTASFSISMLVNIPDYAGTHELIYKGDNAATWWAVALHDNILRMYIDDNLIDKTELDIANVDQVMPAGAWNHIVAIRDREKDQLIIYINGLETGSIQDACDGGISSPGLSLRMGTNRAETASEARLMDEVMLFHSALSAEEVANLYATYVPQLPGNLKAYWKLDGDATDYFETSDGTLVGGDSLNYVPGIMDQALDLSLGTDPTYVEVADNSVINVGIGEFTYSMLLHVPDLVGNREILHKGASDGAYIDLSSDGTDLSFAIGDGVNETTVVLERADKHLYTDGWNHIAAVRDRIQDSIFLYINQRIAASAKDNTDGSIGSALPLIIGAGENMDVKFNGILDEIRFYNEPIGFIDLQSLSRAYGIDPKYIPSSNANISTIMIVPAAPLTPAFAKDVYDYTCALPAGTQSVRVTAFPEDFKSTISGTGPVDVSSGSGTSTLVVTAEDGTVNTYTIDFTVGTTGIDELGNADLKVIYNQSENCLIFENRDNIERVEIFNINGSKLYVQENISSGRMNLNPANLPGNAVYISRIYTADEIGVIKFVKLSSY